MTDELIRWDSTVFFLFLSFLKCLIMSCGKSTLKVCSKIYTNPHLALTADISSIAIKSKWGTLMPDFLFIVSAGSELTGL